MSPHPYQIHVSVCRRVLSFEWGQVRNGMVIFECKSFLRSAGLCHRCLDVAVSGKKMKRRSGRPGDRMRSFQSLERDKWLRDGDRVREEVKGKSNFNYRRLWVPQESLTKPVETLEISYKVKSWTIIPVGWAERLEKCINRSKKRSELVKKSWAVLQKMGFAWCRKGYRLDLK